MVYFPLVPFEPQGTNFNDDFIETDVYFIEIDALMQLSSAILPKSEMSENVFR